MARLRIKDFGTSLFFNGTNAGVTIPGLTPSTTAFSTALWLKMPVINDDNDRIIDWSDAGPTNGFNLNTETVGGNFSIDSAIYNGAVISAASRTGDLTPRDRWQHIALTYTPTGSKIYVNGVQKGTTGVGTMTASSATVTLGKRATSSANFFRGWMDEFMFWNGTELTAAQIALLYASGQPPEGLSCYLKFDEATGTTATDSSGNGLNGTISGATYSTDVVTPATRTVAGTRTTVTNRKLNRAFNYAMSFNGVSSKVTSAFGGTSSFTTPISFSGWTKRSNNTALHVLVASSLGTGPLVRLASGSDSLVFWANASGASAAFSGTLLTSVGAVPDVWYHWVVTYDGTTATLYINGALAGTVAYTAAFSATPGTLVIGSRGAAITDPFEGLQDEVRIHNKVLTSSEVQSLYYYGAQDRTNLVAEYLFDEGSGTTATDSSSGGNNGTITAGTYSTDVVMVARTAVT